jgi:protein-disulfide isomerase
MPAKSLASPPATPASRKGVALLAPAILLLGATLAVGQSTPPPAQMAQAAAPAPAPAAAAAPAPAPAGSAPPAEAAPSGPFTPAQRKEIEAIIKDILVNNPEVLLEAQNALEAKMDKSHSDAIFNSSRQVTLGNPQGDVTFVEFFDYNCGYCKKAFTDLAKLMDKDKKVRVILKELPILAKGSEEASRVALAAKMQGKYWEFHRAMLESQGQANEASALRVAEKLGLDMPRLKKDMASAEVKKEIDETRQLATKMGIQGTPHFIVGDRIIPGAPENLAELLGKHVDDVRKDGCKVC